MSNNSSNNNRSERFCLHAMTADGRLVKVAKGEDATAARTDLCVSTNTAKQLPWPSNPCAVVRVEGGGTLVIVEILKREQR